MKKRISSRAIIIEDNKLIAMFRRRKNEDGSFREYYVIPGGGVEEGESLEENVIREIEEELSVRANILGYLGTEEYENTIAHYYHCSTSSNDFKIAGPEALKNSEENYYKIVKLDIEELDKYEINAKELIKNAINKIYK